NRGVQREQQARDAAVLIQKRQVAGTVKRAGVEDVVVVRQEQRNERLREQSAARAQPVDAVLGDAVLGELRGRQQDHGAEQESEGARDRDGHHQVPSRLPEREQQQREDARRDEDHDGVGRKATEDRHAERRRQDRDPPPRALL